MTVKTIATMLAVLGLSASAFATEILTVDVNRVLKESAPGRAATEHVKKAQDILQKGMDDVIKANKGLETAEAKNAIEQSRAALARQLQNEDRAAIEIVTEEMSKAIQAWLDKNTKGKKERYIVIPKANTLGVSAKTDITAEIIQGMAKAKVKFNDLPKVVIK